MIQEARKENGESEQAGEITIRFMPNGQAAWKASGPVPPAGAVNILEMIKSHYVQYQFAMMMAQQQQQAKNRISLPDGSFLPPTA